MIFNDGVRDFAWLQNPKTYKKRNKNSIFCRRRLGFQKENLMKFSRFLLPPIPSRLTQTLDFPSPTRIIQTHK